MNPAAIAHALGGEVRTGNVLAPGPGHSRNDRSMSVTLSSTAPDGFTVFSFAGDDWQTCKDYVRQRLGQTSFEQDRQSAASAPCTSKTSTSEIALQLWSESYSIKKTPVQSYLSNRGTPAPPELLNGEALRFHPECPFRLESGKTARLPAMIGLMRNIITNVPQGVHRTALKLDGSGKSDIVGLGDPKKMLGPAKGACVKLTPDEEITHGLHIAEGIETSIACMNMGFRNIWAALSAGSVDRFPVLSGVQNLSIFADNDKSGTGQRSARNCAQRWSSEGRDVRIWTPPQTGDFAE